LEVLLIVELNKRISTRLASALVDWNLHITDSSKGFEGVAKCALVCLIRLKRIGYFYNALYQVRDKKCAVGITFDV